MGKSTFEFPLSIYDRPAIAAANLLSGNLDATTRAVFSPMTLSPDEMKNIRQKFLGGGMENDPIIKTAVDLATNPIVIIGLIMALGPWGKIANPAQMAKLFSEGGKYLKGVSPYMRSLLSPMTAFRSMWGVKAGKAGDVLDALIKIPNTTRVFHSKGYNIIQRSEKLFRKAAGRRIDNVDKGLIAMRLEGMHHTPTFSEKGEVLRAPLQGYYNKIFGKEVALAPDLVGVMKKQGGQPLIDHYRRVKDAYKKYGKMITKEMQPHLQNKGLIIYGEDYGPRIVSSTRFEDFFREAAGWSSRQYQAMLKSLTKAGMVGPHLKTRVGNSIPNLQDTGVVRDAIMKSQGVDVFAPGMWDKLGRLESTQVQNVYEKFMGAASSIKWARKVKGLDIAVDKAGKIVGADKDFASNILSMVRGIPSQKLISEMGDVGMSKGVVKLTQALERASMMPKAQMEASVRQLAQIVGAPGQFMMDSSKVFRHYIDTMGPTVGWFKGGTGKSLVDTVMGRTTPNLVAHIPSHELQWLQRTMQDDLAPMLMGMKNYKEYARSQTFRSMSYGFREMLRNPKDIAAVRLIPEATRAHLIELFSGGRGSLSEATLGGKISGLLYTSALGMNMSPVSKNVFQPFITTMNILEPINMARGMKRVLPGLIQLPKYAKRMGMEKAIRKVFPEFYQAFGAEEITKAMAAGDIGKEGAVRGAMGAFDKFKQVIMMPFGASEKWNRLLSFYSTLEASKASGMTSPAALKVAENLATKITMFTQFPGGTIGMPQWARGAWAPFRQFGHFPSRMMEFMYGSMRMGPEGAFTLGPLGRTMAGSAGIYTIMKNLAKMDVSQGLAVHALPGPVYEKSSFYPAPYIPPVVGAVGDVIKAFHTGDFSRLGSTASLFVPGGLGARRAYRTWAPKYAKYDERTGDGRIPIYNEKGALVSTQTPMQLAQRGLGLRPVGPEAEQQMMKYLLAQRDKIREYRRNYLEKLGANDLEGARKVNRDFRKRYPSLGPLKTKKADLRTVKNRKAMTRLHRTLKGFPKEYRPLFQAMTEQATLAQLAEDIDYNPDSLEYYLE